MSQTSNSLKIPRFSKLLCRFGPMMLKSFVIQLPGHFLLARTRSNVGIPYAKFRQRQAALFLEWAMLCFVQHQQI